MRPIWTKNTVFETNPENRMFRRAGPQYMSAILAVFWCDTSNWVKWKFHLCPAHPKLDPTIHDRIDDILSAGQILQHWGEWTWLSNVYCAGKHPVSCEPLFKPYTTNILVSVIELASTITFPWERAVQLDKITSTLPFSSDVITYTQNRGKNF